MVQQNDSAMLDDDAFDEDDEDTQHGKYLTFDLGKEDYGIEIRYVTEIIGIQKITEVPDMPVFVKGVINLRGQVIPVMDVRLRFGMPEREYDERTCVIVASMENTSVGLIVDEVSEVIDIPDESISPPPKVAAGTSSRYIQGMGKIGDEVRILLNVETLLFAEGLESLAEAN